MKLLRNISKLILFLLQLLFDIVVIYFMFALVGCFAGRNSDEVLNTSGVPLLIHGDGFHTELYLPVEDSMGIINWMDWFDDSTIRAKHQHNQLINFAWAEYDWTAAGIDKKPKNLKTVFEILFWPYNASVMHVQWMDEVWKIKKPVTVKRYLSKNQYKQLVTFIQSNFIMSDQKPVKHSGGNKPVIRSYRGYYGFDYIYLGKENYHSFKTCNQFTSNALNSCGIRNATFSPFGWGLFYQVKKASHKEY